jgi:hypothetical protein
MSCRPCHYHLHYRMLNRCLIQECTSQQYLQPLRHLLTTVVVTFDLIEQSQDAGSSYGSAAYSESTA